MIQPLKLNRNPFNRGTAKQTGHVLWHSAHLIVLMIIAEQMLCEYQ